MYLDSCLVYEFKLKYLRPWSSHEQIQWLIAYYLSLLESFCLKLHWNIVSCNLSPWFSIMRKSKQILTFLYPFKYLVFEDWHHISLCSFFLKLKITIFNLSSFTDYFCYPFLNLLQFLWILLQVIHIWSGGLIKTEYIKLVFPMIWNLYLDYG